MQPDRLNSLRADIDDIDMQLVELLARRFALTDEIGRLKREHRLPPADPAREATQMARVAELARQRELDPALAQRFLRVLIDEVVARHQQI